MDPAWAIPMNTALLIILTALNFWHNRRTARRVTDVHAEVVDVKRAGGITKRATDITAEPVHPPEPPPNRRPKRWTDKDDQE